jgi:hypothetical protein
LIALFNSWRRKAGLLALAAGTLLLLTYQWHHERWLVVLGTVAAAACLTIAIDRRSLLWDGICILGLSLAMFRCWNEPVWTVVYAAVGAFGLVQIFAKPASGTSLEMQSIGH